MDTTKIIFKNIKKYGYEKGIPMLIKGLDSKDENLRRVALDALRTISGKRYDPLSYLWRAWWKDAKDDLLSDGGERIGTVIDAELAKAEGADPDTQMIGIGLDDQTVAISGKDVADAWAAQDQQPPADPANPVYTDPGLVETVALQGSPDPFSQPTTQLPTQSTDPFADQSTMAQSHPVDPFGQPGGQDGTANWKETVPEFTVPYTAPDRPPTQAEAQQAALSPEELNILEYVRRIENADYRWILPRMIEQIHHPDPEKRTRIVKILERLTMKEYGEDKVAWERWWDASQYLDLKDIREMR